MNKKALITLLVQLSTMHIKDTPGEVNHEEKHFFFSILVKSCEEKLNLYNFSINMIFFCLTLNYTI